MQAAIPAPAQAVSIYYLSGMAAICARGSLRDPPPVAPFKPGEPRPEPSAELQEYGRRRQEFEQDMMEKASAILAASVARKQDEAKAIALKTLTDRVSQILASEPKQPLPAWVSVVNDVK